MSKFIGRSASIGIGKETSRGTAVAPSYWVKWMEITNPDDQIEGVSDMASLARIEDSDAFAVIKKFATVGWKTKLMDTHPGLLLYSLFGTVASVSRGGADAAVYDHTFSVAQTATHQSLTVAYKDANVDVRYPNVVVNSFAINYEMGDFIHYEVGTMSKVSASASNTVAHVQENEFLPQHIMFKKAATQAGLDAASAVSIRNATIQMTSNTMFEDVLGNQAPNDVLNQSFVITGSVTLVHNDTTYSVLQNAGTYQAFRFDLTHTVTIGATANPRLRIDLHRASLSNYTKNLTLDGPVEESFDFKAHYSLTDSEMATVILTNLTTSY